MPGFRLQHFGRLGDQLERPADIGNVAAARLRQGQRAWLALKQLQPEFGFQPANLLRDRPLRDAQLLGREPEVEMPRHDLEYAQAVERGESRETFRHRIDFLQSDGSGTGSYPVSKDDTNP